MPGKNLWPMENVRAPVFSGVFYPSEKEPLFLIIENFFKKTKKVLSDKTKIKALIVPHAGYLYSGQTAAWGYAQLPENLKGQHFILIGPSHHFTFEGLCLSPSAFWQTPLGKVRHQAVSLMKQAAFLDDNFHLSEHSLEVQLPFLQYLFDNDFSIASFLTGYQIDNEKIAAFFLKFYPSSIFIFSSDLSHYLPENEAQKKDEKTIKAILELNSNYFLKEENTACGEKGILILLEMARKEKWKRELVCYDTSTTVSGDKTTAVGYASIVFS